MAVCLSYIAANIAFLHAIRSKNATLVKAMIAGNFAFASGLAFALVYGYSVGLVELTSWYEWASFILRAIVVLFVLCACYIYAPLWNHYDDHNSEQPTYCGFCCTICPVMCMAGLIYLALLTAFTMSYSDMWEALA